MPRWAFEKLPGASPVLGTMMQSVGEVMAIGRTFPESLQKAMRSLETGRAGLNGDPAEREYDVHSADELVRLVATPTPERPFLLEAALRRGVSIERLSEATGIDPWFLDHVLVLCETRAWLVDRAVDDLSRADWRRVKRLGFSDAQLSYFWGVPEEQVFAARRAAGVEVTYKTVDTCAAEFAARTPYHYGTYEDEDEVAPLDRPAVVILGSGPNRIGQGVEFDYCCVHAAFALSDAGFETVMLNCNPETVSTDYDTSDRLFFEPLTPEDVLAVCRRLQERSSETGGLVGVIVALGRADAAEARAHARSGGHSRPRHEPRLDRPRRRPRAVPAALRRPRHRPAARRHGGHTGSGASSRRAARLPGAGAAVVRARWARDADRLRRRQPRRGDGGDGHRRVARA